MPNRFVPGASRPRVGLSNGIVALATALALLIPRPAAAATTTLSDLQPFIGRVIIIETTDRPQVVGRLVSAGDSALVVSVGGVETTFRQGEVRSATADVDSMRIGLTIGAGVGVAGAILGAQGLSCTDCPGTVAAGAAFSIVAFTALGALIGKHHHRRVTVYQRPSPAPPPVPRR
jgi:hypothetical protein